MIIRNLNKLNIVSIMCCVLYLNHSKYKCNCIKKNISCVTHFESSCFNSVAGPSAKEDEPSEQEEKILSPKQGKLHI